MMASHFCAGSNYEFFQVIFLLELDVGHVILCWQGTHWLNKSHKEVHEKYPAYRSLSSFLIGHWAV